MPRGGRVLDAGAGDGRYAELFRASEYESADFCQVAKAYANVTYVCDLGAIPVEAARYDLVLCTQVLEHVPEPGQVLAELFRVLKPRGQLWLTVPFFYEEHETPYDFYRYTQYGLRYVVERAGFQIARLEWLEGYAATAAYQLGLAARSLRRLPRKPGLRAALGRVLPKAVLPPLLQACAAGLARLEGRGKYTSSGICKNYALVATKGEA